MPLINSREDRFADKHLVHPSWDQGAQTLAEAVVLICSSQPALAGSWRVNG